MAIDLLKGIVRILRYDGTTSGTGFIVSNDGLIITCSHVIQDLKSQETGVPNPDEVAIALPTTGRVLNARVEAQWWRDVNTSDVAFIRTNEMLSPETHRLILGSSAGTSGHRFRTYGFPDALADSGLNGYGIIGDNIPDGKGGYLIQLTEASEITPGFSGAPVLDINTNRVIGMVTSITAQDSYGRLRDTAIIVPVETLRDICPEINIIDVCPYKSLDPFGELDAIYFFGRDKVVKRLQEGLHHNPRFLAVLGPSGCGKSSLISAGLLPSLRKGVLPESERWGIIASRPADNPFQQLSSKGLVNADDLLEAIILWLQDHSDKDRLVIIIDQFEEIVTTTPDAVRKDFLNQLIEVLKSNLKVTIILALRDDFYGQLAKESPDLMEWLERNLINIPATIDVDDIVSMIKGPAKSVGLDFETGLVQAIIGDIAEAGYDKEFGDRDRLLGRSTILPLLEFALTELWKKREFSVLTHKAYQDIGGVTGSLAQWANSAFYSLDSNLQPLAIRVLTSLVNTGDESRGIPNSRRRMAISDLCGDERERSDVLKIVNLLVDARLLVASAGLRGEMDTVEIIHDALIREWGLMQQWLDKDRLFLAWRQEIDERIRPWLRTSDNILKRDEGKLLRGRDLVVAEDWLKMRNATLSRSERDYILASLDLEAREHREKSLIRRRQIIGLAVGLVITTSFALMAFEYQQTSLAHQLASQAELLRIQEGDKLPDSIILADESIRLSPSLQADQTLRRGIDLLPTTTAMMPHEGEVIKALFSPDGSFLATASKDHTVHLWHIPNGSEANTLLHSDILFDIDFSADGRYIATASADGTAKVWEVASGKEIANITHGNRVRDVAFSPGGLYIATASEDKTARISDAFTGEKIADVSLNGIIYSICFSPDGEHIALGTSNGELWLWDIINGKVILLGHHDDCIYKVIFSSDGNLIASASLDKTARIWNASNGEVIALKHKGTVWDVAFSPDGRYLATASEDKTARVWDTISGSEIARFAHNGYVMAVKFCPDGENIATASGDNTARIWEISSGREVKRMIHDGEVRDVATSPDGTYAATASFDRTARLWNLTAGPEIFSLIHNDEVLDSSFSPDGKLVATASGNFLSLWDLTSGSKERSMIHDGKVNDLCFSPNGKYIAASSFAGDARVWETNSSREVAHLNHSSYIWRVTFSPDGKYFGTASADKTAKVWDLDHGKEVCEVNHNGQIYDIAFSPDNKHFATAGEDGMVRIWNRYSGYKVSDFFHDDKVMAIAFSPNGKYLATASGDAAHIWDIQEKKEIFQIPHEGKVFFLTFSPDGRYIATASYDSTARVFDVIKGKELITLHHGGNVIDVAFSPDGKYLATGSEDDIARVWEIENGEEVALVAHNGDVYKVDFSPDGKYLITASADKTSRIYSWKDDPVSTVCDCLTHNIKPEKWREYIGQWPPYRKTCPNLN